MYEDLAAAGIPKVDEHGEVYEFHSLRHQYITELARSGVSIQLLQRPARHSTPVLTARYTHFAEGSEPRRSRVSPPSAIRTPRKKKKSDGEGEQATDGGTASA